MANAFSTDGTLLTVNDSGVAPPNARRVLTVHTFEDDGNWSAQKMAQYQSTPAAGGSYHIVIDKDGVTYRENDDEFMPWAAFPTGNRIGYHFSLSGKAAWSREQWLARPKQLSALARVLAAYSTKYGIPLVKRDANEVRAGKWGVCGHNEISFAFKESDHTDPGRNFPYDVVLGEAKKIQAGGVNAPATPTAPKGESDMTCRFNHHGPGALNDAKEAALKSSGTASDNQVQLRGPGLKGWDVGVLVDAAHKRDPEGNKGTLVELTALLLTEVRGLKAKADDLSAEVRDLRAQVAALGKGA